jgi:hypothetical protein
LKPELENEQDKWDWDSKSTGNEGMKKNKLEAYREQQQDNTFKIKKGLKIKLDCEFCKGPISTHPYVFKFANFERFFCCAGCMSGYKQKYAGRIESIKRKFEGKD